MIQINDLYFSYRKNKHIFEDLTLHIKEGQIYGILGENGVGKTTLLRIMAGLLFPKKGRCAVYGVDAFKRLPQILEKTFYLPEEFQSPHIRVKRYAQELGVFYPQFSMEQFVKHSNEFEVELDKKFSELSLGQKKKTLISLALSTNAQILLLDEPTNGLDIPSKAKFRKIMAAEANEKRTFIISTHQVHDIEHLMDRIMILERNAVLLNNSVEEITAKLKFSLQTAVNNNTFYSETRLGGFSTIELNNFDEESKIDIECLFNAVVKNKNLFKDLFKH